MRAHWPAIPSSVDALQGDTGSDLSHGAAIDDLLAYIARINALVLPRYCAICRIVNIAASVVQVTTGIDKTLRVWNHAEWRCELVKDFGEDVRPGTDRALAYAMLV